jgi:hypothetical protein
MKTAIRLTHLHSRDPARHFLTLGSGDRCELEDLRGIGLIWALLAALLASGCGGGSSGPIGLQSAGSVITYALQDASDILACSDSNGVGTAGTADLNKAVASCSGKLYTLGGTISGLTRAGLVLTSGANIVPVASHTTSFTLPTSVAYGNRYAVAVAAQPAGLTCSVSNGAGLMPASNVTSVKVKCLDSADPASANARSLNATALVLFLGLARSARSRF